MLNSPYLAERARQGRDVFDSTAASLASGSLVSEQEVKNHNYAVAVSDNAEWVQAGQGKEERVFANIFDLLLYALRSGLDDTGHHWVYRGQRDSRWFLVPSSCRNHFQAWAPNSVLQHWPNGQNGKAL
jgi:hypothetical protein